MWHNNSFFIWLRTMTILISTLALISTNLISVSIIKGNSMYPTLKNGEIIFVNRMDTCMKQGDVVLIEIPSQKSNSKYIVKRVIAIGGEKVSINYDSNNVYLNDVILPEPYINQEEFDPMRSSQNSDVIEYVVPYGYIFVMGDNRNHSTDSRYNEIGLISEDDVIGKAIVR